MKVLAVLGLLAFVFPAATIVVGGAAMLVFKVLDAPDSWGPVMIIVALAGATWVTHAAWKFIKSRSRFSEL